MQAHLDELRDWRGWVRVLMPDEYKKHSWSFFTWYKGDSWHGSDTRFIFWLGANWVLITILGFVVGGGYLVGLGSEY